MRSKWIVPTSCVTKPALTGRWGLGPGAARRRPPPKAGEGRSCRAGDASRRGPAAVRASDAASRRRPLPSSPASGGGAFVPCGRRLEDRCAIAWLPGFGGIGFLVAEPAAKPGPGCDSLYHYLTANQTRRNGG